MTELCGLFGDNIYEFLPSMAMHEHPERRNAIDIAVTLDIDEIAALPTVYHERNAFHPILHLRKGMPHIPPVPFSQLVDIQSLSSFLAHSILRS